jgi:LysR family transcriptional regulator, glycine cleavage system transcriptional activator
VNRKTNEPRNGARRLPPLNALRAFEAAARHMSFARAAQELHVTPAAVSHQIKGLEEHLGLTLFHRLGRGLELTRAGQAFLPKLREGFERLAEAAEELHAYGEPGTLAVSAAPSFATRWLAPRLHRFVTAHPELDVRITADTRLIDPARGELPPGDALPGSLVEDSDVAVRFGLGDYPGFRVDKLLAATVAPMCSPALLRGAHPLRAPADLQHHVLIHDNVAADDGRPLWDEWLESAGVRGVDTTRGLRFNHVMLALDAAADGLGVTLGLRVLAEGDLAAGRLVVPFGPELTLRSAYYLVSDAGAADRSDVAAFREWLLAEAARPAG